MSVIDQSTPGAPMRGVSVGHRSVADACFTVRVESIKLEMAIRVDFSDAVLRATMRISKEVDLRMIAKQMLWTNLNQHTITVSCQNGPPSKQQLFASCQANRYSGTFANLEYYLLCSTASASLYYFYSNYQL